MHGGATWRASPAIFWQISTEIPCGAACVALRDSQSTHARHAERAGWLRGALGEAGGLVWCCRLLWAHSGHAEITGICGELSARQVEVGPREADGNHFEHAPPESFARENRKRGRSIQDIHTHVGHATDRTADTTHASCNTRNAATG